MGLLGCPGGESPPGRGRLTTPPCPRESGTLDLCRDARVSTPFTMTELAFYCQLWFSKESAPSLHLQQVPKHCTGATGGRGHCRHWRAHGRPQSLLLLNLCSLLFLCEIHTGPEGSWTSHGAQLCPDAPTASSIEAAAHKVPGCLVPIP